MQIILIPKMFGGLCEGKHIGNLGNTLGAYLETCWEHNENMVGTTKTQIKPQTSPPPLTCK